MAGEDNLTPWEPGQSGNPEGRPKGSRNRTTIVKEMLEAMAIESVKEQQQAVLGDDFKPQAMVDQITAAQMIKALAGDTAAFKELMDSGFGKLTDKVDNTHNMNMMGRVKVTSKGEGKEQELNFDVGKDPQKPGDGT